MIESNSSLNCGTITVIYGAIWSGKWRNDVEDLITSQRKLCGRTRFNLAGGD